MLRQYSRELKDKVRKELIELLEYDPAPQGSLQAIAKRQLDTYYYGICLE